MKCNFCSEEFDDKFVIGDPYESIKNCPGCKRFVQITPKGEEEEEEEQRRPCQDCESLNTETYIAASCEKYDEVYYGTRCLDCECKTED